MRGGAVTPSKLKIYDEIRFVGTAVGTIIMGYVAHFENGGGAER